MAAKAPKSTSIFARFRAARDGAAAVEFALVATPFIALLFGILELGMVFMVSTTLDNATEAAARTIRTGQVQLAGSPTQAKFKTAICDNMAWLGSSCSSSLHVDVRTYSYFKDVTAPDLTTKGAFDEKKTQFVPGAPEAIVVVRAYYEWSLITPMLNEGLQTYKGSGKRMISSTVTFRNEPYIS